MFRVRIYGYAAIFFLIFLVQIFLDPKFGRVMGAPLPRPLVVGQARGDCAPNGKISFLRFDFETYGAVHTTFTTKTMVEMGLERVILAQQALDAEIWPILGPKL